MGFRVIRCWVTLDHSAVDALMEAIRSADGIDLVRESVRLVMQELIEADAAGVIGARRYERTDSRVTERNGYRDRLLATQAGDIELRIPKLRQGSFFPEILQPRRRIDQALYAVVMEAYVAGVSTRSVDDLIEALGIGSGISKSEVSRICAGLDESVDAFRNRRLDHIEFPYVFVDATYVHCRENQPAATGNHTLNPHHPTGRCRRMVVTLTRELAGYSERMGFRSGWTRTPSHQETLTN